MGPFNRRWPPSTARAPRCCRLDRTAPLAAGQLDSCSGSLGVSGRTSVAAGEQRTRAADERPWWHRWQQGSGPAETGSRISPALLVRKQPGAAVLVAEVSHRPPSLNKFRVDRHNPRFAGLILSRAGVRPARDKINLSKRGLPETPFHPNEYLNSKINSVTGWG